MKSPTGVTWSAYDTAVRNGNATHAKVVFANQNKTFTDANISADGGIQISTIGNQYNSVRVGNVIETEVTISFIASSDFTGLDWTEEFELFLGVDISNVTSWISMGLFVGKEPKIDVMRGTFTFTAYDRMRLLNKTADDLLEGITYVVSLHDMIEEIGLHVGLSYSIQGSFWSEVTWGFQFDASIFSRGITLRDLLGYVMEATGCIAYINNSGTLVTKPLYENAVVYNIYESYCFDINVDGMNILPQKDCAVASDSESGTSYVYPSQGTNPYVILDNPIISNADNTDKDLMLNKILDQYNACALYIPYTVTLATNWMFEPGDYVLLITSGNNPYIPTMKSMLQNMVYMWNGHCEATFDFSGSDDDDDYWEQVAKGKYKTGGELSEKFDADQGNALQSAVDTLNNKNIPDFKSIGITGSENTTVTKHFTVSSNSRIRIDFITAGASRRGISLVYCSGTGGISVTNISLGSNITVAYNSVANQLDVSVTNGSTTAYCTIYAGDISA